MLPLRTRAGVLYAQSLQPALTMTSDGLVLGRTVLAKMRTGRAGKPELRPRRPGGAHPCAARGCLRGGDRLWGPGAIRRASNYCSDGEAVLAAIALARTGLPPLDQPERVSTGLSAAERLLDDGLSPCELIKACGLDPVLLDVTKAGYNPTQPRVPAGNPNGGQWTSDGFASGETGYGLPVARPSTATRPAGEPSNATGTIDGEGPGFGTSAAPPAGGASVAGGIVFVGYKVIREPPADAKVVTPPDGTPIRGGDPPNLLIAPPHADYRKIYRAGQAIAEFPPWKQYDYVRAAIGQEGTYDFQRDVVNQKFYQAYTPAANYAVGVYMAGAGYALDITLALAKLYALQNSSNYGAQDQLGWIKRGWRDGKSGRWR